MIYIGEDRVLVGTKSPHEKKSRKIQNLILMNDYHNGVIKQGTESYPG